MPQVRRGYTNGRRLKLPTGLGRKRLPAIPASYKSSSRNRIPLAFVAAAVALLAVIALATSSLWLPAIRWVVPDRYIMAYAPEALALRIFDIDPDLQIPTPQPNAQRSADALLGDFEPPPTPTPTEAPLVVARPAEVTPGIGGYLQPTSVPIAPTPTVTPAAAAPVDSRAVDREHTADLSQVDALLTGFNFQQQTGSNNCGPASFATMISYWDVELTQTEARNFLKPNADDPNVRPDEMIDLAESLGYHMLIRDGGDLEVLKRFILAGYPVMIETGYDPEPDTYGWMSHFLTLVGFSESRQEFIAMDTYRRPNWSYPYDEIDLYWRQFNRRYLVAYRSDQATAVASIIGENMDDETMYTNAMRTAQSELSLDREDPYAWFNLGTSLVGLGRYDDAALAYDEARSLGLPARFLWYQFGPFEAYLQVGREDDVIELADFVLGSIATEEPFYYKGMALLAEGNEEEAARQFNLALRFNHNYDAAQTQLDLLQG